VDSRFLVFQCTELPLLLLCYSLAARFPKVLQDFLKEWVLLNDVLSVLKQLEVYGDPEADEDLEFEGLRLQYRLPYDDVLLELLHVLVVDRLETDVLQVQQL
jgi:hypothetical protein